MNKEITPIKEGICSMCDVTVIFYKKERKIIYTPEYSEFVFTLSNNMIFRHSICKNCLETINDDKVAFVIERIKRSWSDQMVGSASDTQFEKVAKLELGAYDISKTRTLRKHEENVVVQKKEQLEKETLENKDRIKKAEKSK